MNRSGMLIGAFFAVGLVLIGWKLSQPDDTSVDSAMTSTDTGGLGEGMPIVTVKLPAELTADAQIGKQVFEAKCAACHGENAAGQNGVAPPLVHKIYEPGHHADMAFVLAVQNGVRSHHWRFGNMPSVAGLTQGDVKLITRYIRELQQANGIN